MRLRVIWPGSLSGNMVPNPAVNRTRRTRASFSASTSGGAPVTLYR
jgi:hypothetical protein